MISNKQVSNIKIYTTQDYFVQEDNDSQSVNKERLRLKE